MVNQRAICFKIDLMSLDAIDNIVRDSRYWTNRNRELNKAVAMYIKYCQAKAFYNEGGEPGKMREFCQEYLNRDASQLFK